MKTFRPQFALLGAFFCIATFLPATSHAQTNLDRLLDLFGKGKKAAKAAKAAKTGDSQNQPKTQGKPQKIDVSTLDLFGKAPKEFVDFAGKETIYKSSDTRPTLAGISKIKKSVVPGPFADLFKGDPGYNVINNTVHFYSVGIGYGYKSNDKGPAVEIGEAAVPAENPLSVQALYIGYGESVSSQNPSIRPFTDQILNEPAFKKWNLQFYVDTSAQSYVEAWMKSGGTWADTSTKSDVSNVKILLFGKTAESEMTIQAEMPISMGEFVNFEAKQVPSDDGIGSTLVPTYFVNPKIDLKALRVISICLKSPDVPYVNFRTPDYSYEPPSGSYLKLDDFLESVKNGTAHTAKLPVTKFLK